MPTFKQLTIKSFIWSSSFLHSLLSLSDNQLISHFHSQSYNDFLRSLTAKEPCHSSFHQFSSIDTNEKDSSISGLQFCRPVQEFSNFWKSQRKPTKRKQWESLPPLVISPSIWSRTNIHIELRQAGIGAKCSWTVTLCSFQCGCENKHLFRMLLHDNNWPFLRESLCRLSMISFNSTLHDFVCSYARLPFCCELQLAWLTSALIINFIWERLQNYQGSRLWKKLKTTEDDLTSKLILPKASNHIIIYYLNYLNNYCLGYYVMPEKSCVTLESLHNSNMWKTEFLPSIYQEVKLIRSSAPVAHLVVRRAVTWEVVSSRLRPDQHSGSLNNWAESAAFVIPSANG